MLQVTTGCSHNEYAFCNMYIDVSFQVEQIGQVEKDLIEARLLFPQVKRVILVNGDPFILNAKQLTCVAE